MSSTINSLVDISKDNICYIERTVIIPFPITPIDGMDKYTFDHLYAMDSTVCIDMMGKDEEGNLKVFKDIRDNDIRDILINYGNVFYRYTQAEHIKYHNRAHLPHIRIKEWWVNLKHVNDYIVYKSGESDDDNIDYIGLCFGDPSKWNGVLSLNSVNPTLINNDEYSWRDMNPVNAAEEIADILKMRGIKRNPNELPSCVKEYRNKNGEVAAFYVESDIKDTPESES